MSNTQDVFAANWELAESIAIDSAAETVYSMISDIARMGEWSPECVGGAWVSGTAGEVGSHFHGYNRDGGAEWTSESKVIEAKRPHRFGFSVLSFRAGGPDGGAEWMSGSKVGDMTWSFEVEENGAGCVLTQRHVMRTVSPFYRAMLEGMDEDQRSVQLGQRKEQLRGAMKTTLARIKDKAEQNH
ncbi:polyketide cyclase/dehydrase/lipid transport protein [Halopolyspora algeriensis]|uniref:Polyketide cyclase/dehydrase/lipid transport protein n=1 Tax=Halopolyspora algeriensis TaxID=1500506 RepID=A0A368V944_9ACTN|nr:SRPBCC family protein [Halopolyspora algeriensis]RCW37659.1 polyketide cyclase/dehydrase/lipid transport protein [Halopolyspora algeriensis]TQM53807.1 polyketide cyclase/dehydrase/lipid transport protein [Halopolyspora algeriensis]